MLLEGGLFSVESRKRLQSSIINAGAKAYFCPIIEWVQVTLTRKGGNNQPYTLAILRPATTLMDVNLLRHRHKILICHLLGRYPSIHIAQVSLIVAHIGKAKVELCRNCEEKERIR